jgi:hypothetical protein
VEHFFGNCQSELGPRDGNLHEAGLQAHHVLTSLSLCFGSILMIQFNVFLDKGAGNTILP